MRDFRPDYPSQSWPLNWDNIMPRIERHYVPEPYSGCWLWTGGVNSDGYASITIGSRRDGSYRTGVKVYRLTYEFFKGPIPRGMTLDHLCRVRCCVNPAHLEIVPGRVNILRGEGPTAKNARKTHCWRGHLLTHENTYIWRGWRFCRTCHGIRNRRYQERRAAGI